MCLSLCTTICVCVLTVNALDYYTDTYIILTEKPTIQRTIPSVLHTYTCLFVCELYILFIVVVAAAAKHFSTFVGHSPSKTLHSYIESLSTISHKNIPMLMCVYVCVCMHVKCGLRLDGFLALRTKNGNGLRMAFTHRPEYVTRL